MKYSSLEFKQTSKRGDLSLIAPREYPPIILGTANFGLDYGIANNHQILSSPKVQELINWAQANGTNRFDTASAYGTAQDLLGSYLDKNKPIEVDSKLDPKSCDSSESILIATERILKNLGIGQLSVLYLHDENLLSASTAKEISKGMNKILEFGLAKQVGVSVYSEEGIARSKKIIPELSVFQVPENICDRRLIDSDLIANLYENGNTFIVRSIFLQGLLLMEPSLIPRKLSLAKKNVQELIDFAEKKSLTAIELCLAYARSISWVSGIIVGAASLDQLKEVSEPTPSLPSGWASAISPMPTEIIDPRKWS